MLIYAKYNNLNGLLWYVLGTSTGQDLTGGFDEYDGAQRWIDDQQELPGTGLAIVQQSDGTWSVLSTKNDYAQHGLVDYKFAAIVVKILTDAARLADSNERIAKRKLDRLNSACYSVTKGERNEINNPSNN